MAVETLPKRDDLREGLKLAEWITRELNNSAKGTP